MNKPVFKICALLLLGITVSSCKKSAVADIDEAKNAKSTFADATAAYKDTVVTNFFRRESGHIASDAGFSVPLSNGKVLWLMGDSHIDDYRASDGTIPWLFQVRNAGMLQPKGDWNWRNTQTLIGDGPAPQSYLRNTYDKNLFIWPNSGFEHQNHIYVYCGYLKSTGTGGAFGFGSMGRDLWAKIRMSDMKVQYFGELPDFKGINFGLSFIKDPDSDYMYTYGNRMTFIYNDIFLARFKLEDKKPEFEYWTGGGFSKNINEIKRVGEAMSSGCHVTKVKDKFVIVSSEFSVGCDQGKRIYIATSDRAIGPFTPSKPIYTIDDVEEGHYPFFYAPILHPEYINEKNEVLLTYAINGYPDCLPGHVNYRSNPDWYRLRGVRIPYSVILNN